MIKFNSVTEGIHVDQWCEPPVVYLDHWAWRKISESETLLKRFANALKSRGGTLAFSWLNVFEFSRVTDENQTRKADALLDKILPHVFVLDPNFFKVIGRENELFAGGKPVAPHADFVFLKFFAKHNLSKSGSLKLFPAQNIFHLTPKTGIAEQYDDFADSIITHIESLRRDYDNDPKFRSRVKALLKGQPIQCGTRFIAGELIGSFFKNKQMKVSRNHAIDVSHAIVAVAYCDYALLDSNWATQVLQARKRITDGGLSFPMAKVFSEKAKGIERFLLELETQSTSAIS